MKKRVIVRKRKRNRERVRRIISEATERGGIFVLKTIPAIVDCALMI